VKIAFQDVARFYGGDHPDLVEASFACPLCLRNAALVIASKRVSGGHAWAYCAMCHVHTEVALNAEQMLRLLVAPPKYAPIHVVRAATTSPLAVDEDALHD
jgi:hypothetical protein